MHGTLWNAIFTSLIGWEINVIDTLRFNNDANFSISIGNSTGNATEPWTLVQMYMVNERYQQNRHNRKWQTWPPQVRWQLGFLWHWRGIELVFKSLDCFTVRPFYCCYICICCLKLHPADYQVEEGFFTSIWWGSTQLQCIYYLRRILIARPPRVFWRFKRRSCFWLCLFT